MVPAQRRFARAQEGALVRQAASGRDGAPAGEVLAGCGWSSDAIEYADTGLPIPAAVVVLDCAWRAGTLRPPLSYRLLAVRRSRRARHR
ncbi:hypothetical protein [Streptomyces sp. NPDC058612]|uniref:hypothetical protein n=1 Tax=Streptomyces sp. NPDC058612 TaxID=3346555 RepID=UPI0036577245